MNFYVITVAVTDKPGFYQNSWIAEFFGIPIYVTEETKISAKKTKNAGWATVIWNEGKLKMYLAEKVRKPPV